MEDFGKSCKCISLQQAPHRNVIFEGKTWACLFECIGSDIKVQATDFNTAFAEATLPVQEIVLQVKDGGTRMSWDALCPKFIESFEASKCFRMERAFDRLLIVHFDVHLTMSNDPPIQLQLTLVDAASARDSMLKLTWALWALHGQVRTLQASGNGLSGAVLANGPGAASDTVSKDSETERPQKKKPKKIQLLGAQPDSQ